MISLVTAAIAPAIALLCFFYLKDEYEQEPVHMVFKCFIFGALLVFPTLFIQYALQEEQVIQSLLMEALVQSAFIEEFLKWFIVMLTVYSHIHFNQRYDGIVYATAVALGFASAENVLYLLSYGLETAFLRALFPLSSHALFGVVMGYYLGKAKFYDKKVRYLFYSFFFPFLLHGLYNIILLTQDRWIYFLTPFMIFLWLLGLRKIKKANLNQAAYFSKKAAS
ncbi:Membrane proteinase PrsW, cleaves anti-sigma factor RsiW, M82 family [Evansella caseinilytica]|uniref:Protease PrsW n=1 Tax=Evansella caseinilytica TaxID=1503961 RepID=A0A1H3NBN6_9BACI|nr:glutamic-type intramembrane protease PrsW [Evansella caseinilytica]SDY86164.1 Membrane proteinase PrsW, cleaves anti-sigma factor RsiW, M82 family [Evansella caseinilytica]